MPISYEIAREKGVVCVNWEGDISCEDVAGHWKDYYKNREVMSLRKSIIDVRKANILFSSNEFVRLIDNAASLLNGLNWIIAIVVETPVQRGVSNQFQVFAGSFSRAASFSDPDEALHWLVHQEHES